MKQQMRASAYTLSSAEMKKLLLKIINPRDRCIIRSLYWLGVRRQELVDLDVRDIDFERRKVTVREGKGGKSRPIPIINDDFLMNLRDHTENRKSGPVFLSNRGDRLAIRTVNQIVENAGKRAGIKIGRAHV